jgi:hypothetical protein
MRLLILAAALSTLAGPASGQSPAPSPAPPPPACTSANHRALDFWVGHWDVSPTGSDKIVAHSLIERLYDGCAIRENWMPLKGNGGGSLSSYDPQIKGWQQLWVDSSGATVRFKGGAEGKAMVLTGQWTDVLGPGKSALIRMTYTPQAGGTVRQRGESSIDGGKSWKPNFDFTYRPAAATAANDPGGSAGGAPPSGG